MPTFALRHVLRRLWRDRSVTLVALAILALGIGANTAIFSVLDSILLQPLPFPRANRLVQIDAQSDFASFPKGWIREYQRRATTFASISGYTLNTEYNVTDGGTSDFVTRKLRDERLENEFEIHGPL